jgi:hypothetical protein
MKIIKEKINSIYIIILMFVFCISCDKVQTDNYNNANKEVKVCKTLTQTVGSLHNQALDAYISLCIDSNELIPALPFLANYFNIDMQDAQTRHALILSEFDNYNSLSEYLNHLESDGIYSSSCVEALRQIFESEIANYSQNQIDDLVDNLTSTAFANEIENTLIYDLCSIIDHSYVYWREEQNVIKWSYFDCFGCGNISNPEVAEWAFSLCMFAGLDYVFAADVGGYFVHYMSYNGCEPANRDEDLIRNECCVYASYYSSEAAR